MNERSNYNADEVHADLWVKYMSKVDGRQRAK